MRNLHSLIEKNRAYAIFRKTVLEAKKKSWNNFINKLDFRKPTSKVYEFMKKMNNRATSGRSNPPIASDNKLLVTDDEKADAAAKFMSSTVGRGDPDIQKKTNMDTKVSDLGTQGQDEPYNRPFIEQELMNVINKLPDTSPGPDKIL